ncbi:Carnitine O-acetyltransferase mitochondrial [Sorochytrium milnesiophthora]
MRSVIRPLRLARPLIAAAMHTKPTAAAPAAVGPLFKHQSSLEKLPVPTLDETLQKYLTTVRPFLSDADFARTQAAVSEFAKPGGAGQALQKKLEARSVAEPKGWLADWWTDYAYMAYRDPVVINVNYFFHFRDDKLRKSQAARAASIIQAAVQFRDKVVSQELEPEMAKKTALDSEQYKWMFNACRVPRKPSDFVQTYDPVAHNHVAVVRKNKFYTFDVFHANGQALSTAELEQQLQRIIQDAGDSKDPAIGSFTVDHRDKWTDARAALIAADPKNERALKAIESSLFLVCLDDQSPVTREEVGRLLWHGDGRNRFFDKSLQFIVFENGKAGFNGEHSMMDATPTGRLCEWVLTSLDQGRVDHGTPTSTAQLSRPQRLEFTLTPTLRDAIAEAQKGFDAVVDAHELQVLAFDGYGKGLMKKFGMSPDGYVQMALQLAYYKMYGVCRPTYESAQTRKYAYGRTETGRSVSNESVAWVKAMESADGSNEEKAALLKKAIAYHGKYMADASVGKGVDRHLLGLRLLLGPNDPKPSIFSDPAYTNSCHWNLSTSQLTSEYYDGYGWGEVVPDGYGLAYMIKENSVHVNMTSQKLGALRLRHYMTEALQDMRKVCEATVAPAAPLQKAKLTYDEAHQQLLQRYPARRAQLEQLLPLLDPTTPAPPSIFVYGPHATGKTTILQALVNACNRRVDARACYISATECHTARVIWQRALTAWSGVVPGPENGFRGYGSCDSISDFVWKVQELIQDSDDALRVLVIDNAERLRRLGATLLPALVRLSELTGRRICVVLATTLPWENFRSSSGASEPVVVAFPQYTKDEAVDIIMQDCPSADDVAAYAAYAPVMYDMFSRPCSDLNELRYLIALLWPSYMAPVRSGQIDKGQTVRLFRALDKELRAAFTQLYLRETSSAEWAQQRAASTTAPSFSSVDLPTTSKYLLIAAFLASFNPATMDRRFFDKASGPSKKQRKMDKAGGKMRQQQVGPKGFAVERMLAIFATVANDMETRSDIEQQIATLVSLRLVARTSAADQLTAPMFKCNVGYDFVLQVAQSVRFPLSEYLHDFA